MNQQKILISGAGSIGMRHARNLRSIGMENIVQCDPNGVVEYADFETALEETKPDIVFICSPTKYHIDQSLLAAKKNAHLFIEKPLAADEEHTDDLLQEVQKRNLVCMVGCNMRFHHGPATVKRLIDEGAIGSIISATVSTGSYLPNWRPQQDYRKSYSADPLQGGAILDCIHEIDLALWYAGPARLTACQTQSAAEIGLPEVVGTADLTLAHASGATSSVHLSFTEQVYKRSCLITGERGTIHWDITKKEVEVCNAGGAIIALEYEPENYDMNQMYIDEIRHFLQCCQNHDAPQGNLAEASSALHIALAAKRAAA